MIKLGIVMDPIQHITIKKDSSFAMLLKAQERNYEIFYMEIADLYLKNGDAWAEVRSLTIHENEAHWFDFGETKHIPLSELNVILMRKDPPFDNEYIYATYMLERAQNSGTLIVNNPQSLRDANEKLFTSWFSQFTPETLVSRKASWLKEFIHKEKDTILKPLDGMGGASIFRVKENDPNIGVIIETITNHEQSFVMAQKFIPEITQGDKRILIVFGQVVPYCLARIPADGETRGNLAAGGRGVAQPLSKKELSIAEHIAPELLKRGLYFVGLDMIGEKITEINVTSPTCIREIEAAYPVDVTGLLFNGIEKQLKG